FRSPFTGVLGGDDGWLDTAANSISSGELVVAFRRFRSGAQGSEEQAATPPAPKAVPAPAPAAKTAEPELPTFDPDHDAIVQARTLIEASNQGIPFCEECMRAAALQAQREAAT
ncbi:MAG: hypothetical protein ACREH9_05805, partial [Pseudomonadota bacterium]